MGLYPVGVPGQQNANRALGVAIVLGLSGLRVLASASARPHPVASGISGLAALLLILNAFLAAHDRVSVAVTEGVCGAIALTAAVVVFTRDRSAPATRPQGPDTGV